MNEIDIRPWGKYEILLDEENTKVKKISVNPGQKLSYQSHQKRQELWVVVKGSLSITIDDNDHKISYGEMILIPLGSKHRAYNETDKVVEFIEVQTGEYFGEEELTRYKDDYGRK
tara:strand:- start:441 stop:785 length:345 start_codon:yes stop_codon:yes gene_type:complete